MEPKNQIQKQVNESENTSQSQSSTSINIITHPFVKKPNEFVSKDSSSEEEDIHSDERQTSKNSLRKEPINEVQSWQTPKDNEGWQTGNSSIPENASDNPNG